VAYRLAKYTSKKLLPKLQTRELEEKTGLTDIPLTHPHVYIELGWKDFMISKVLYHVLTGTQKTPFQLLLI